VVRVEKIYTTLLRDTQGLGFSIAGGQGATPFKDSSESIFVSKITENGTAMRDGKLRVGDRIVQINGVDVTDARHDQAVQMLTGLERFVRLVVERETLVPRASAPSSALNSSSEKSPKVFGAPKPYTGLYSANSYMANRPSYGLRSREPGNYGLNTSLQQTTEAPATYNRDYKLPGLGGIPGEDHRRSANIPNGGSGLSGARSSSTLSSSHSALTNTQFEALIPDAAKGKRSVPTNISLSGSSQAVAKPGVVTESVTKTTFTETTVKRVTQQAVVEEVALLRSGGPLGLSIIGGSDHSCIPFGTGEQGIYISKIIAGGAAAATGKLRMGDRLLAVNTTDIRLVTHQEAVMALLQHCKVMKLTIQHDPLPPGFKEISVVKQPGEKLGMIIKGGLRGQPGNPLDPADEGVFCVKVNPGSRAAKDSGIYVGQRIIEVNGQSLLGATHQEAVNILRNAGDEIKLLVCDGFDPAAISDSLPTQSPTPAPVPSISPIPSLALPVTVPSVPLGGPEELNSSSSSAEMEENNQTVILNNNSSLPEPQGLPASPSTSVSSDVTEPHIMAVRKELEGPQTPPDKISDQVRATTPHSSPPHMTNSHPSPPMTNSTMEDPLFIQEEVENTYINVIPATSTPKATEKDIEEREEQMSSPIPIHEEKQIPLQDTPTRKRTLPARPTIAPKPPQSNRATSEPPSGLPNHMVLSGGEPVSLPSSGEPSQDSPMPELLSLKDRLRLFEKEIDDQQKVPEPKKDRKFSFLSDDEVVKMKEEEAKRIASMTALDLEAFDSLTSQLSLEEDTRTVLGQVQELDKYDCSSDMINDGTESRQDNHNLTEAEKRAAWRKARLDSLEDDALQAQLVIEKMSELSTVDTTDTARITGEDNFNYRGSVDIQGNITATRSTHLEEEEEEEEDSELTTSEDTTTGKTSPVCLQSGGSK